MIFTNAVEHTAASVLREQRQDVVAALRRVHSYVFMKSALSVRSSSRVRGNGLALFQAR